MSATVLEQRAAMQRQVTVRTMCEALSVTVARSGSRPAYSDRSAGPGSPWQTVTWARTRELALILAAGFVELGLRPGEKVALMLPNRLEHVLADFGALHAGGIPVTFYATLAPEQIAYMAADCDARIAVLDGEAELARWQPVLDKLTGLRTVIVRDTAACPADRRFMSWEELVALGESRLADRRGEVEARIAALTPDDPVTLLYTSGTTTNPKGVLIRHASVLYEVATAMSAGTARQHTRWVSYLPLAHIAERMFTVYLATCLAGDTYFCHNATTELIGIVGEVKPTAFFGVPRVWEKIEAGIRVLLSGEQDASKRAAVAKAMDTGQRYVRSCQFGEHATEELAAEFARTDAEVLRPIRSLLGLGDAEVVVSAAAPLPAETAEFFAGLGMPILDVYGMTETTGAFTANTPQEFRLGTVGRPVPGTEVKIARDGEILTRGPLNAPGYLNLPERTSELIDADGWLHTGDVGFMDADGFLSVVDRKNELIITSGGENISPAAIENLLVAHPLIGQAMAYGDRRPYVVALLTLDGETAPAWARARGIEPGSLAQLAERAEVLDAVGEAVEQANARLARVQQVKKWRLLPVEWTAETEELTPTLKLKRRVVWAKYADALDALYSG